MTYFLWITPQNVWLWQLKCWYLWPTPQSLWLLWLTPSQNLWLLWPTPSIFMTFYDWPPQILWLFISWSCRHPDEANYPTRHHRNLIVSGTVSCQPRKKIYSTYTYCRGLSATRWFWMLQTLYTYLISCFRTARELIFKGRTDF